jgi:poly(A) polymerase
MTPISPGDASATSFSAAHRRTTSATPGIVLDMFPRTFAVGAHFGVVLVASPVRIDVPSAAQAASAPPQGVTEVATFRNDGVYSDGRHPDEVRYTKTAAEDVRRRDFTINGLLLDPMSLPGAAQFESGHDFSRAAPHSVGL